MSTGATMSSTRGSAAARRSRAETCGLLGPAMTRISSGTAHDARVARAGDDRDDLGQVRHCRMRSRDLDDVEAGRTDGREGAVAAGRGHEGDTPRVRLRPSERDRKAAHDVPRANLGGCIRAYD